MPGKADAPPQVILHAPGLRKRGLHLRRERYKDRFLFQTTHITVLFKVPIIEYFIELGGKNYCYPVKYKLEGNKEAALNIYSLHKLPKGFNAQEICAGHLRGMSNQEYLYIYDQATEQDAINDVLDWKRYGGDIGAIVYDSSRPVQKIVCEHMHLDMGGRVVCGIALGKRGRGGDYMDGCIINKYDPPEYCPQLPENKHTEEPAEAFA